MNQHLDGRSDGYRKERAYHAGKSRANEHRQYHNDGIQTRGLLHNLGRDQVVLGLLDEKIEENIERIIEEVKKSIPPKSDIKNIYLKLTMGKPVLINLK